MQQNLTKEEEEILKAWITQHVSMGTPYERQDLIIDASAICGKVLGRRWYRCFMKRHPDLQLVKPVRLDPKRTKNFNKAIIDDYFDKLEEFHAHFEGGIPPEHIWNMDEKGIQMGGGRKNDGKKYIFLKGQRQKYQLKSDNLELVTVIKCISAAGEVVPPSFCLQNGRMPDLSDVLPTDKWGRCISGCRVTISKFTNYSSSLYLSESGWTDSTNCANWFREIFIPCAKECRVDDTKPIVLTMDGHSTHETAELIRAAYDLQDTEGVKVNVICFPSKTTHKCQLLDVLIFSAIERQWQAVCKSYLRQRMDMNRFTVIPAYINGTWEALTKTLIAQAFEKAGLYPVNRAVFSSEDFAPSQASSIIAHIPPSFPTDFPSSDPYIPSSESEWLPGSDMDVDSEDDCSWSDAGGISHAPKGPQPATPTEGHALTTVPEQAVHGPKEPQPATPTGSHALIPVPEQVAHPSASEGLGDALDTAPDTE